MRIIDVLGLVVLAAFAVAALRFFSKHPPERDQGEVALWLVTLGTALCLYLVYGFTPTLATRLILLGITMGGAVVWFSIYEQLYLKVEPHHDGFALISPILVLGGVISALPSSGTCTPVLLRLRTSRKPECFERLIFPA